MSFHNKLFLADSIIGSNQLQFSPDFLQNITLNKPVTRLAQNAINKLNGANANTLSKAINTVKNKDIAALGLVNYIERKARFSEILNKPASEWNQETIQDMAAAFQMNTNELKVMDAIVSISVLNDPDLDDEIRIENTSAATDTALQENRRIVWQYPKAGTPLDPPYVVLVAVEHQDEEEAAKVIESIMNQLVSHQGYKIPKAARAKLSGQKSDVLANLVSTGKVILEKEKPLVDFSKISLAQGAGTAFFGKG